MQKVLFIPNQTNIYCKAIGEKTIAKYIHTQQIC